MNVTRSPFSTEPFVEPRADGDRVYSFTDLAPGASAEREYQELGEFSLDISLEREAGHRERYLVGYSQGGSLAITVHDDFVRFEEHSVLGFSTDAWPVSAPASVLVRQIDAMVTAIEEDIGSEKGLKVARVPMTPENSTVVSYRSSYGNRRKTLVTYEDGSVDALYFDTPLLAATTNDFRQLIRRVRTPKEGQPQTIDYWRDAFVRVDPPMDEEGEFDIRASTQQLVQDITVLPQTFYPVRDRQDADWAAAAKLAMFLMTFGLAPF